MNDATLSNSRKKLLLLAGIAFVPLLLRMGCFFSRLVLRPQTRKIMADSFSRPLRPRLWRHPLGSGAFWCSPRMIVMLRVKKGFT